MGYIAVLRDRSSGIVIDISFSNKDAFKAWYDSSIQETDEVIAEGIEPEEVIKYTNSSEAIEATASLLTPESIVG